MNINWEITEKQISALNNSQKLNEVILIKESSVALVSANTLDLSAMSLLYVNSKFNFDCEKKVVIHNLSEVLRMIRNLPGCNILLKDDEFSIVDKGGKIKCNFKYASESLVSEFGKIYDVYNNLFNSIEESDDTVTLNLNESIFDSIKKFSSASYDTVSFKDGDIVLYDRTAGNEIDDKDNVVISIAETDQNEHRLDLDMGVFKSIVPGNYTLTISPLGYFLFQDAETGNSYAATAIKF